MARTIQTALPDHQTPVSSPTANPPIRLHTDFVEIKVHTAKCDSCDKHNKLTIYRCVKCGLHVCSLCWNKKPGEGIHVFGNTNHAIEDNDADVEKEHENEGRARAKRRVHVVSDDEDDDSVPVLKPAPTTESAETNDASNQHTKKNNVIMNNNHYEDHEDDLPRLWPMAPARRLPVLRPAPPAANTSATESANQVTQRNSHIHGEKSEPERQRIVQIYDKLGRQTVSSPYAFVSDQETNPQARRPSQSSISHEQATRSAPLHAQRAIYRPRPGADVDRQAARNQLAFADHQHGDRQAPQPGQASVSHQQTTQIADGQNQPAVYRPRPGADVDQQAARNQQIFRLNQQAQAYADAKAKQTNPHNQRVLVSHRSARPTASRDQIAAHNQQAFISNQLSSSDANYVEQMVAARDEHLSRQQANRPTPGPPEALASHRGAINSSPLPAQAFLLQQHAAHLASRQAQHRPATQDHSSGPSGGVQVREHSPEILKAADALLFYAGVEQKTEVRSLSDQDANGVSQLLNAAGQLDKASSARSEPPSSSKTPVSGSEDAETQSVSPHGPALNPSSRTTGADSAKARIDKHRARLAGLNSAQVARNIVSDPPASLRGHPSYRHATIQPESESALADSSAAQSHGSSFRDDWPHLDSRRPVSDHAATYLNQWNSGRAALSSRSSPAAVDEPATQLNHPRSPIPARRSNSRVKNIEASGSEPEEAAEVGIQALKAPAPVPGGPSDGDVLMNDPDVEILEHDESRHGEAWAPQNNPWTIGKDKGAEKARARVPEPISVLHVEGRTEKHQRSEKKGDRKTSKELKASADVDVVGARKRNSDEEHSEQIEDDVSDTETTSWNNLDSDKTIDKHQGTNAGAKGPGSGRMIKKGIAYVKRQEPKGQKGKMTAKYDG